MVLVGVPFRIAAALRGGTRVFHPRGLVATGHIEFDNPWWTLPTETPIDVVSRLSGALLWGRRARTRIMSGGTQGSGAGRGASACLGHGAGRSAGIAASVVLNLARAGWAVALTYWTPYDARMQWGMEPEAPGEVAEEGGIFWSENICGRGGPERPDRAD
ncbi:hypothetical protein [Rhodococcus opacus]|uniref:hypothetical protein n=1 Tax=Rhodococcus opacus TaxID=37919 RepID=UPI001F543969|nr:hypothetical protein [Rhodococcus opacus]